MYKMDYDFTTKNEKNNGDNSDGISLLQREINQNYTYKRGVIGIAEYFGAPSSVTRPLRIWVD